MTAKRTRSKATKTAAYKAALVANKQALWTRMLAGTARVVPPPSKAEAEAAIARYLATNAITRCPTRAAETFNAGDGFDR